MSINFTMSDEQKKLQHEVRAFAENVLAPVVAEADREPDPVKAVQRTKPAYVEAYKAGIAMCMLPTQYGGGGVSCVDLVIAAEEICVVDPGFACTVLCNGLGLMPVSWYGSEEQKERFLRAATSDPTGEYLGGWTASEPPGNPSGTANFDIPLPRPAGRRPDRHPRRRPLRAQRTQVLALVGRLGRAGREPADSHRPHRLRRRAAPRGCPRSSSSAAPRGSPTSTSTRTGTGSRPTPRSCSTTRGSRRRTCCPARGQRRLRDQPQLRLVGPGGRDRRGRGGPCGVSRWPWTSPRATPPARSSRSSTSRTSATSSATSPPRSRWAATSPGGPRTTSTSTTSTPNSSAR